MDVVSVSSSMSSLRTELGAAIEAARAAARIHIRYQGEQRGAWTSIIH